MESYNLPAIDPGRLTRLAQVWVNQSAEVRAHEHVVIVYDFPGRQLAQLVAQECLALGARVTVQVTDPEMEEILALGLSERDLRRSGAFKDPQMLEADVVFIVRAAVRLDLMSALPQTQRQHLTAARKPVMTDYRVNYTRWQLIYWPTPAEAAFEGMAYEDYVELWLSSGDQPWPEIEAAQDYLVRRLDAANELLLEANAQDTDLTRRTRLTMSIAGMTFINSTIKHNFPGAEVFSAPVRDSVQGQLFAAGTYSYQGQHYKDILFTVENGQIVRAVAQANDAALQELLDTDAGSRYFGEIAFGTNPGLRRRLYNGLLNEKVGGSFHITPGAAYEDTNRDGKHVDNGNRSSIHWDITTVMLPDYGGGRVVVDGEVIQEDGRWLPVELAILNRNF